MSATYDETLPVARDRIRAILGDTDLTAPLLTDEHIDAVLVMEGDDQTKALVFLADELIVTVGQEPVKVSDNGAVLDFSERLKGWRDLVARLRPLTTETVDSTGGGFQFVPATFGDVVTLGDEYARPWGRRC